MQLKHDGHICTGLSEIYFFRPQVWKTGIVGGSLQSALKHFVKFFKHEFQNPNFPFQSCFLEIICWHSEHFKNCNPIFFQSKTHTSGAMVLLFGDTQVRPARCPPVQTNQYQKENTPELNKHV